MRLAPCCVLLALTAAFVVLSGCERAPGAAPDAASLPVRSASTDDPAVVVPDEFGDYWYQGQAEITSYTLEQARYGELRPGEAVLIYVTEPFSRTRHVKLDDPEAAGDDAATVLKLNSTRTFVTGVYPYSLMTSVFTPIGEGPMPFKITTSAQEWCGHTFTQLNRADAGWRARLFSYFERESDRDQALPDVMPEDGLWTLLRLDPERLPTGRIRLLPSGVYGRLSHRPLAPEDATTSLSTPDAAGLRVYTVHYPALERILRISFQATFPFAVEGWEEERPDGFGPDARRLTTRAVRKERLMLDYWTRNGREDEPLRTQLGLGTD